MWKWSFAAICFIITLGTEVSGQEQSKLNQYFASKCRLYSANAQVYDHLTADVSELKRYSKYVFSYLPKNKDHFCKTERPFLIGRMQAVANNLALCLPTEEQYLPKFLQDLFDNFLHFLCVHHGANMDNFFSSQGEECRKELAVEEVTPCFQKIFAPSGNVVRKKELCDDLDVAKKCFSQNLEKKCPNFRAFQELNDNLFTYLDKPCSMSSTSGALTASPTIILFLAFLFMIRR